MDLNKLLEITVVPRAKKTELVSQDGNIIKIKLQAPPVDGAANKVLIRFLVKYLGISKSKILIVRGEKARKKFVRILK